MATVLSEYFVDSAGVRRSCQRVVEDWRSPALPAPEAVFSYLVNAIGHAFFQLTDAYCKVVVRYKSLSDACLIRLFYDLHDLGDHSLKPAFIVGDDRINHRFSDPAAAADYVVARVKQCSMPFDSGYSRRRLAIAGRSRLPFRRLRNLCTAGDVPNFGKLSEVLRADFADRYCIVQPDQDGSRLLLAGFGGGYEHLDVHWDKRRVGTPFGEFTDRNYSSFVRRAYLDAWRAQEPVLEEIKAPGFPSHLPRKYERILLPIRLSSGPALLSATLVHPI
jgi:hypothetical protein